MRDLLEEFVAKSAFFSATIGEDAADVSVKIIRVKGGDTPWEVHDQKDQLCYVLEGTVLFEEEGSAPIFMTIGEMFNLKNKVMYRISSKDECKMMMIENKNTLLVGR